MSHKKNKSSNEKQSSQTLSKQQKAIAKEIIKYALYMKAKGLTPGHSGNISVRFIPVAGEQPQGNIESPVAGGQPKGNIESPVAGGQLKGVQRLPVAGGQPKGIQRSNTAMLITPTGVPYEELKPKHIVMVSEDVQAGEISWDENGLDPSSEWQFHLSAYKANSQVNALVHTHSNYATTLACAGTEIPPFHYMVAAAGVSTIPLVPYAIFGSQKLSAGVAKAFKTSKACLLAHHGQLAGESTLAKAMELAEIIEDLSQQYWALQQLGKPSLLSEAQMRAVITKFKSYGQSEEA